MGILDQKVKTLPESPGVYLMKGRQGNVLYVGKAKDLKARIRAYTGAGGSGSIKTRFLIRNVSDLDYIVTRTEKEALLLEHTLIKRYKPPYNVVFKDDKTFLHIVIDTSSPYPRLALARRPDARQGVLVFGPYTSASAARETLRQIQRLYPLRTCKDREYSTRRRPCIHYQMRRCLGPCSGEVSQDAYRELVDQAVMILQGRNEELVKLLEQKMEEASEALRYEEAATLRDRIRAIRTTIEQQRVVDTSEKDQDVIGFYQEGPRAEVSVLEIRNGRLVGCKGFSFPQLAMEPPELLASFLLQYYDRQAEPGGPLEVVLPFEPEGMSAVEESLFEMGQGKVTLFVPRRSKRRELVRMANLNAKTRFQERRAEERRHVMALEEIRAKLGMERLPRHIECIDLSSLQGTMCVGARVTFKEGLPYKDGYRRYKITMPVGADDYAMMYEVLMRSYRHTQDGSELPDLLLVDGGRGHVAVTVRALKDIGIRSVSVAGIAKARHQGPWPLGEVEKQGERDRIFVPGRVDPVRFDPHSAGFRLLQHIRNEAHRFAQAYHHHLRSKAIEHTGLDGIPGIGKARKRMLMITYAGDLEHIRNATVEELARIPGITKSVAKRVWNHFHVSCDNAGPYTKKSSS